MGSEQPRTSKPGPDELHVEDDEGRAEMRERLGNLILAAQGFNNAARNDLAGAADDVWHFIFGEFYPWPEDFKEVCPDGE